MAVEFIKRTTNSTAIITCPLSGYHTHKINIKNRIKNTTQRNKLIIYYKNQAIKA